MRVHRLQAAMAGAEAEINSEGFDSCYPPEFAKEKRKRRREVDPKTHT
jgi:hypothetical protein